ncbi:Deoxynucleotidyltransferase terminal-interacting protein 2 [Acanthosepion pharaonis]|uniref:Deoxynucleotidyltransferase terminal-interacting protein 2 n=1 Tax=Acanthosepion pharaonis TaxID=158019 RepID=A0A812DV14_ACAPH|nr:Deoxynucleotidyltransferase terminal-interacting protein 2 [Sepia pharaonis]
MVSLPTRRSEEDVKSKKAARVKKVNTKNPEYCLSSTIDPHLDKLLTKSKSAVDKVLNTTKLAADPTSEIISKRQKKKMNKERRDKVCSDKWFNMKAPELTKDVKNQLSVLQLREILDRKNFYKSNDRKKFPKFFQMGKVVESPADFYHARIPKKQRKATLLDEVMADADLRKYQKRKYAEIFGDAKKTKNKKKRKPYFLFFTFILLSFFLSFSFFLFLFFFFFLFSFCYHYSLVLISLPSKLRILLTIISLYQNLFFSLSLSISLSLSLSHHILNNIEN